MNSIIDFLQPDTFPVDFVCVVLVLLAGQWQKNYLQSINISPAWKTLIVSIIFCALYIGALAASGEFSRDMIKRWVFSYVLATSFYELILKKWLKKWFPDESAK